MCPRGEFASIYKAFCVPVHSLFTRFWRLDVRCRKSVFPLWRLPISNVSRVSRTCRARTYPKTLRHAGLSATLRATHAVPPARTTHPRLVRAPARSRATPVARVRTARPRARPRALARPPAFRHSRLGRHRGGAGRARVVTSAHRRTALALEGPMMHGTATARALLAAPSRRRRARRRRGRTEPRDARSRTPAVTGAASRARAPRTRAGRRVTSCARPPTGLPPRTTTGRIRPRTASTTARSPSTPCPSTS